MTTILYFFWLGFKGNASAAGAEFENPTMQGPTFSNPQMSAY
jgi:hypothetical protein